jgi:hypothetical protein
VLLNNPMNSDALVVNNAGTLVVLGSYVASLPSDNGSLSTVDLTTSTLTETALVIRSRSSSRQGWGEVTPSPRAVVRSTTSR